MRALLKVRVVFYADTILNENMSSLHLPSKRSEIVFHQKAQSKSVELAFDFVFTVWVTHLVRAELKVYFAPYGTSAAGPSEQSAA